VGGGTGGLLTGRGGARKFIQKIRVEMKERDALTTGAERGEKQVGTQNSVSHILGR